MDKDLQILKSNVIYNHQTSISDSTYSNSYDIHVVIEKEGEEFHISFNLTQQEEVWGHTFPYDQKNQERPGILSPAQFHKLLAQKIVAIS